MDAIQALLSRRSVRKFSGSKISEIDLKDILACGLAAPSSKNAQPWRFHVVTSTVINKDITALLLSNPSAKDSVPIDPRTGQRLKQYDPTVMESIEVILAADVAIYIENMSPFAGGRENIIHSQYLEDSINGYEFELVGIGAAIQNILVAAHSKGLGAVFMGDIIIESHNIEKFLDMDGDLVGVVAIGQLEHSPLWDKPLHDGRVIRHG